VLGSRLLSDLPSQASGGDSSEAASAAIQSVMSEAGGTGLEPATYGFGVPGWFGREGPLKAALPQLPVDFPRSACRQKPPWLATVGISVGIRQHESLISPEAFSLRLIPLELT
jgi:hypothetical protein